MIRALLLRLGIAVLATAAVLVGALRSAADPGLDDGARLGASLALSAAVLPAVVAGALASAPHRRSVLGARRRATAAVLVVVQAAAVLVLTVVDPRAAVGAVVLVVVLDLVAVLLGRAAMRVEGSRAAPDVGAEADAEIVERIGRAERRGATGAMVGLVVGAAALVLLVSGSDDPEDHVRLVLLLPTFAALGAAGGMVGSMLLIAGRVREVLGSDRESTRRIARALRGRSEGLSEDEERRATRYAAVAPAWLRLQIGTQSLLLVVQVGVVGDAVVAVDGVLRWFGLALLAVVLVVAAVLGHRTIARTRAYARTHPVGT